MPRQLWTSFLVAVLFALGCGRVGYDHYNDLSDESGWQDDWPFRVRLSLDSRGISEDLRNVPVLVTISDDVVPYATVQSMGQDLRFVASDDVTILAHEIDTWAPGDSSRVWVRVPFIAADSQGDFMWLYYGNPTAEDGQRASEVWEEMHAVWHLGNPDDALFPDSASGHHGRGDDQDPDAMPVPVAGHIGMGQRFDGTDDVIAVTDSDSFNFTQPGLTLEAWVRYDSLQVPWNNYLGKGGYTNGYRIGISEQGVVGFQITGERYTLHTEAVPSPGAWHYIVGTWDGTRMRVYVDGVVDPVQVERPGIIDPSGADFALGIAQYPFPGELDEVRVSSRGRSAAWIQAQYRSMTGELVVIENR